MERGCCQAEGIPRSPANTEQAKPVLSHLGICSVHSSVETAGQRRATLVGTRGFRSSIKQLSHTEHVENSSKIIKPQMYVQLDREGPG